MSAKDIALNLAASGETDLTKFVEAGAASSNHKTVLEQIVAWDTPGANATVKRMVNLAKAALRRA